MSATFPDYRAGTPFDLGGLGGQQPPVAPAPESPGAGGGVGLGPPPPAAAPTNLTNIALNTPRANALLRPLGAGIGMPQKPIPRTLSSLPTRSQKTPAVDVHQDFDGPISPAMKDITDQLHQYLQTPFLAGGADPDKGLDFPGFIRFMLKERGIIVPRSVMAQMKLGQKVAPLPQAAQPGDVLFFTHDGVKIDAGLYLGEGQFVHSPKGDSLTVSTVQDPYYQERLAQGRRLDVPAGAPVPGAPPVVEPATPGRNDNSAFAPDPRYPGFGASGWDYGKGNFMPTNTEAGGRPPTGLRNWVPGGNTRQLGPPVGGAYPKNA